MLAATLVLFGHAAGALLLSWAYFRRYPISRPPIGVFNLWDVAIMIGAIIVVPYIYLILPSWLVAGLLAVGMLSVLAVVWEPILRVRWATWLAALAMVGADIAVARWFGAPSTPFFVANNLVLTLAIVGITNLWAQSGMRASHIAALAGALAIYDVIATWGLPLMSDLFSQLAGLPLAPLVAWPIGDAGVWLGIGLGDLLLATGFPLVMRKAFGLAAGLLALTTSLGAIGGLLALAGLNVLRAAFPVMVVLGPLMLLQYGYWRRRQGQERTTWQYLWAEPTPTISYESISYVQGANHE